MSVRWDGIERLLDALRAEVLHEAADAVVASCPDHTGAEESWMDCHCDVADELRRMADEHGKDTRPGNQPGTGESTQAAELVIYRASYEHEQIPLGLYTSREAARAHCEAHVRCELLTVSLDWIEDEEDGVAELVAAVGEEEHSTGYVVTPIEVASAYDEEADE